MRRLFISLSVAALVVPVTAFARQDAIQYKVLATAKTSTMEKELNSAGAAGYRLSAVMGGDTAIGGKEAVAVLTRTAGEKSSVQ